MEPPRRATEGEARRGGTEQMAGRCARLGRGRRGATLLGRREEATAKVEAKAGVERGAEGDRSFIGPVMEDGVV